MGNEPEIDMLEDAEFETLITAIGDDQLALTKFVARQQFTTGKVLVSHGKRLKSLEHKNKRLFGFVGGIGALIATAIMGIADYFLRKGA